MQSVTIAVSNVPTGRKQAAPLAVRNSVESLLQRRLEAMALTDERLVCCKDANPFAQAAHDAFYDHRPLRISPDAIWFCIAQGFAQHVNLNAESLRHQFVSHTGKLKLVVRHDEIVLGEPSPWQEAFAAFSEQIACHVGKPLYDTVVADFSTTTAIHRAATEIALMDSFQAYFDYELLAGCGIPEITITGAPDDWCNVRVRAEALSQYGLSHWVSVLLPILDQIEATSRGHGNRAFWESFFRYRSGSGGSAMTGWILTLFPYLVDEKKQPIPNPYLGTWAAEYQNAVDTMHAKDWRERELFDGPYLGDLPSGLCSAPVKVADEKSKQTVDMRFVAGMFGVSQDEQTGTLSPAFGWAVAYDKIVPPPVREGWRSELDQWRPQEEE